MESVFGELEANKEAAEREKELQLLNDEVKKTVDYMLEQI